MDNESSSANSKREIQERKQLISQYATAAVCLYGVISMDEFVSVFNGYETANTTAEEAISVFKPLAQTDDVEYSFFGEIISGPEFQPQFDDYLDNVEYIRACQKGKPRYLPNETEFLKYAEFGYREPEKPYAELKAYILKHHLTTYGEGIDGVDGDLLNLQEMILNRYNPSEVIQCFIEDGYSFEDIDSLKVFTGLVIHVYNNTRTYDNNGFTPSEIPERFNHTEYE